MQSIHRSVLLNEAIEALNLSQGMVAIDVTLGAGGHSREILERIGSSGKLIAFDQDPKAISEFERVGKKRQNVILINDNFENLDSNLENLKIDKVDAILADLGYSSDQLEDKKIGLSFKEDSPLDMRLSRKGQRSAKEVVNEYSQEDLKDILVRYSDERFAGKIAAEIVRSREALPIETTSELVRVISQAIPKKFHFGRIHFATKTFQALRMEVNRELETLESFLLQATNRLASGGRLAVITFHSIEDRIVKNYFREASKDCVCPVELIECRCDKEQTLRVINRKPIIATEEEIEENPRSRSAKLRIAEKI